MVALSFVGCAAATGDDAGETGEARRSLRVTLANVAQADAPWPSSEAPAEIKLSVGLWALHGLDGALLRAGTMATGTGIESLAERGDARVWSEELAADPTIADVGLIDARVPGQSYETDPIGPGTAREFEIDATLDERLSIAVMFVQSNDMMLATVSEGIALDVSTAAIHDVTAQLTLWDAGTEENESPGAGPNQAPRQETPDSGTPEDGTVQPIGTTDAAGFTYPDVATFARVEIELLSP
jgi:hypothetical protein